MFSRSMVRCHELHENAWVQVSGLWVLIPTAVKISLEKSVVANLFLVGSLLTPLLLRDVSSVNPLLMCSL